MIAAATVTAAETVIAAAMVNAATAVASSTRWWGRFHAFVHASMNAVRTSNSGNAGALAAGRLTHIGML